MATSKKQFAIATALSVVATFIILVTTTPAEQSVLVGKPAAAATESTTGPILPPPQNPNDRTANSQRDTVDLPPPSESVPTQEVLPTPPQRPLLPPQTNQQSTRSVPSSRLCGLPNRFPARGKLVGEEPMPMPSDASPSAPPTLPPPEGDVAPPSSPLPSGVNEAHAEDRLRHSPRRPQNASQRTNPHRRPHARSGGRLLLSNPANRPACCVGEPSVSGGRGLLGRGLWPTNGRAVLKPKSSSATFSTLKVDYEVD